MQNKHEEYKRFKANLEDEYRARLAAGKAAYGIEDEEVHSPTGNLSERLAKTKQRIEAELDKKPGEYGGLSSAIRKTLQSISGKFTVNDFMEKIAPNYPNPVRPSVSAALARLAEDEKNDLIRVVKLGKGNQPTIYERK